MSGLLWERIFLFSVVDAAISYSELQLTNEFIPLATIPLIVISPAGSETLFMNQPEEHRWLVLL